MHLLDHHGRGLGRRPLREPEGVVDDAVVFAADVAPVLRAPHKVHAVLLTVHLKNDDSCINLMMKKLFSQHPECQN